MAAVGQQLTTLCNDFARMQNELSPSTQDQDLMANQLIYKYSISVKYVFKKPDNSEGIIEFSKSLKWGPEFEMDKKRCTRVYREAVKHFQELRQEGTFFYDGQAALYSYAKLEQLSFTVFEGVSRRKNFVRAEFVLEKDDNSFEMHQNSDSSWFMKFENCVHYMLSYQ